MTTTSHTLYTFGNGTAMGDASMKNLLGGKGANLAEMAKLGLPIPAGVTITTEVCTEYQSLDATAQRALCVALASGVIEAWPAADAKSLSLFPLLSVRSGARVSMPGMMDTILNVGITSKSLPAWKKLIGERAALDSYRRLIQMYGMTVHGVDGSVFEAILHDARELEGVTADSEIGTAVLQVVCTDFLSRFAEFTGVEFPDTLQEQLAGCIGAVFGSWMNERAIEYRMANKIPHEWGTAVTVQQMVFGNLNDASATGVLFTRNPSTGEPGVFGEYLINAQGEDVVAGIRTPEPLIGMKKWDPKVYADLITVAGNMEKHARDMQDMEFTVEDGKLYVLQTRNGKRGAKAAFRIAHDMMTEGLIDAQTAVSRVTGKQFMALKRPAIAADFKLAPSFEGLPAAGTLATGVVVLTASDAKASKVPCILVTEETTPDDFGGMMAAAGILTRTGGATSHAAVVARGMDKTCVVGASTMKIGKNIKAGDTVTIDGATGRVWVNVEVPVQAGGVTVEASLLASLALKIAKTSAAIRVTLDPNSWGAALPMEGTVVLDVSAMVRHPRARKHMRDLINELSARANLRGVMDFQPAQIEQNAKDAQFLAFLGVDGAATGVSHAGIPVTKLKDAIGATKWTKKLLSRWTITGAPAELDDCIASTGWGVARTIDKLADFFTGSGLVTVTSAMQARLAAEGMTVDAIMQLAAANGLSLAPLPVSADADTLMFAVFGK